MKWMIAKLIGLLKTLENFQKCIYIKICISFGIPMIIYCWTVKCPVLLIFPYIACSSPAAFPGSCALPCDHDVTSLPLYIPRTGNETSPALPCRAALHTSRINNHILRKQRAAFSSKSTRLAIQYGSMQLSVYGKAILRQGNTGTEMLRAAAL